MPVNPSNQTYLEFDKLSNWDDIKKHNITVNEFYRVTGVSVYITDEHFYREFQQVDSKLPFYPYSRKWVPQTINNTEMSISQISYSYSTIFKYLGIINKLKSKVESFDFYAYRNPYTNFKDIDRIYNINNLPIGRLSKFKKEKLFVLVKDKDYYNALLNQTNPQFIHENQLKGNEKFPITINHLPVTIQTVLSLDTINNVVGVFINSKQLKLFEELVKELL